MLISAIVSLLVATAQPQKTHGGANQVNAVSGCMNQWLFNGVWRLRVTGVEPYEESGQTGYSVNVEIRNGTRTTTNLHSTGVQGEGEGVDLVTNSGDTLKLDDLDYQHLGFQDVIQGAGAHRKLLYHFSPGTQDVANQKPAKFIMLIDKKQASGVHYTMPDPSFRVDLTCDKGAK